MNLRRKKSKNKIYEIDFCRISIKKKRKYSTYALSGNCQREKKSLTFDFSRSITKFDVSLAKFSRTPTSKSSVCHCSTFTWTHSTLKKTRDGTQKPEHRRVSWLLSIFERVTASDFPGTGSEKTDRAVSNVDEDVGWICLRTPGSHVQVHLAGTERDLFSSHWSVRDYHTAERVLRCRASRERSKEKKDRNVRRRREEGEEKEGKRIECDEE